MVLLVSLACSSAALAALPSPSDLRARPDAAAAREVFKHAPPLSGREAGFVPGPPSDSGTGWDILDYVLAVRIDPVTQTVAGRATISAVRIGEGDLVLHADGPEIGGVWVAGEPVTPVVEGNELHIAIGDAIEDAAEGDTATVVVEWTYDGAGPTGIQWGRDVVYSFHEPIGARSWLPVYDNPADKATLTWEVTAPDGWVVAANGIPDEASPADEGWTTWRYRMEQPIATYLMTVHLSDYVLTVTGDDIPVYTWAYPGSEAAAADTFGTTAEMLAHFSDLYAPYPFPSYGNAMAPFGGAMEHTTCVTFSADLVGAEDGELVNAHELGHHWWGDDVTLGDWDDIWLNEGFATYTEALWYERAYGQEGLTEYSAYLADSFFEWQSLEGRFPVYDPLYMWGGVVYDKGGLVVHMLRGVLGDERFFAALADYEAEHHLGTAVTTDLIASVEASSGEELGWFFDEWVYGIGEPVYTWSWAARPDGAGAWQLDLAVAQDLPSFRMPVPVRVAYADGTTEDLTVTVEGEAIAQSVCLAREPVGVTLDPDLWVLRAGEIEEVGAAAPPACGALAEEEPAGGCACGTAEGGAGALGAGALGAGAGLALLARRRRARGPR
ncbi:MAG: M1 family metallopeptidase [Pseudomonadota bacterium]|nr:M1 family metallopeptidase [Pseudomonadota bacterium]